MQSLISYPSPSPSPSIQLVNGLPVVSSLKVAEHFEKQHKHVLDAIGAVCAELPQEYREPNFRPTFRTVAGPNNSSRQEPLYLLTRDGFTLVAMGFTGKKALQWKIKYIEAFNAMERRLANPAPQPRPWKAFIPSVEECVRDYLAAHSPAICVEDACEVKRPFYTPGGAICVFLSPVYEWFIQHSSSRLTKMRFAAMLRKAGCIPTRYKMLRPDGRESTRSVYLLPKNMRPDAPRKPASLPPVEPLQLPFAPLKEEKQWDDHVERALKRVDAIAAIVGDLDNIQRDIGATENLWPRVELALAFRLNILDVINKLVELD